MDQSDPKDLETHQALQVHWILISLYVKYKKKTKNNKVLKILLPVGFKLGVSVGVIEGDFVGLTEGVNVRYSEKLKDRCDQE